AGVLILGWVAASGGLGELTALSSRALFLLSASVLIAVGVGDTAFFESTRGLGLARAMTVSMTYPLLSALMAAMFLGEPLSGRLAVGSLLTLGGLVITVSPTGRERAGPEHLWFGIGGASLASLAWAVSVVMLKPSLGQVDAIQAQAVRLPVAALLLWSVPWTWRASAPLRRHGLAAVWRLLALGALTGISSVMFVAGVRHTGVAVATVLSSTAPIFAIPLGLVFLGERLTPIAIAGSLATVVGIAVLQL
ncbi:MAG TPA: DMT family transporter, partial [Candidatus Methylomirabilis sp.]|nr:DMT family transporter [Candidatus Methylomirabilis sp.]